MQIDRDQKATFVIVFMLLAGFGFGVYLPNRLEQNQLSDQIALAEQQANTNEKSANGLRDLRTAVVDMRKTLEVSSKLIPESNELATFLRTVDHEIDRGNMIEAEKLTERIVEGRDYNVIPLTLRFRGDYNGVFQLVKKLEGADRLIRINRFEVKGNPTKPEEPVDVRVELSTFSLPMQGAQS